MLPALATHIDSRAMILRRLQNTLEVVKAAIVDHRTAVDGWHEAILRLRERAAEAKLLRALDDGRVDLIVL